MQKFTSNFVIFFTVGLGLMIVLLNAACVSEQFKYLELQQEMELNSQHIQQKEKTIHDLDAFIELNRKTVRTLEKGGSMIVNGKTITLIEARQNIQNAQTLLTAMQSERDQLIEKQKSLYLQLRNQTTSNSGKI
jgi:hypothetical protein